MYASGLPVASSSSYTPTTSQPTPFPSGPSMAYAPPPYLPTLATPTQDFQQQPPSPPNGSGDVKGKAKAEEADESIDSVASTSMLVDGDEPRKKRKKASRACYACQRAHLTCDDGRPCERCIKRGCAETCQDGRRKKAKYLRDIDDEIVERRTSLPKNGEPPPPQQKKKPTPSNSVPTPALSLAAPIPSTSQPANQVAVDPTLYQSLLPGDSSGIGDSFATVDPFAFSDPNLYSSFASQFGSEGANLEYSILGSMLSNTSYNDPPLTNGVDLGMGTPMQALRPPSPAYRPATTPPAGPVAQVKAYDFARNGMNGQAASPSQGRGAPSPATSTTSSSLPLGIMRPDEVYTAITQPYPYASSYHDLIRHLKEKFERADILRVIRALALFRPSLIALQMPLSEEDEIFVEKCFQRTLIEYERLISFSGTPTVVWRRTCEICLVGPEFCMLTKWKKEDLLGRKRYIFELFDNASVVEYYEQVAAHAFENTTQTVMTTCNLLTPSGKPVPCSFCFSIKRDLFSVPSLIIGQFLPQVR